MTEKQAQYIKDKIAIRLAECKLELNEEKTHVVLCKDKKRKGKYRKENFDFLGYTFRARTCEKQGQYWDSFLPAVSNKAKLRIHEEIRGWRVHRHTESTIQEIANYMNPKVRGWLNYYGAYYKSAMYRIIDCIQWYVTRWVQKKYRCSSRKARRWLNLQKQIAPNLFAHWTTTKS